AQWVFGRGLVDVVHRPAFEGLTGHVDGAVGGNQNDGEMRVAAADFFQKVEAIAVREADVEKQQIVGALLQPGEPRCAGIGAEDTVSFTAEEQLKSFAYFRF